MTYILVIWTALAFNPNTYSMVSGWQTIGEFHRDGWNHKFDAEQACHAAAKELDVKIFRCIRNK